jgi:ferredoxin
MYDAPQTTHRIRIAVQVLFFVLFCYLLLGTLQTINTVLPHDLFFLADPLAGIGAILASRTWIVPMIIGGAIILLASLFFGRAWCGWVCPLGTVIDWVPARRVTQKNIDTPRFWRQGKNLALVVILSGALLGSLTLIVLDPVTLLFRSLAAVILPVVNVVLLAIDKWLYNIGAIQSGVVWFDTNVRAGFLGELGFYLPNLVLLFFFAGILSLNAVRPRAWCRYLCPLGSLLGLVSGVSLFRHKVDTAKCISCHKCAVICPTGAIDVQKNYTAHAGECTVCLDCVGSCPAHAISFPVHQRPAVEFQPERRQFFTSVIMAVAGAAVLRFIPSPEKQHPKLIRPPGSTDESLAGKCIRCGECIKVCPTGAIQPANSAGAWDSTWSPSLDMRRGYCDYSCVSCGQACPTGAIAGLPPEQKRKEVIGVAVIDKKRCLPFAEKKECIVCEEMCPLPQKAITLIKGEGPADEPQVNTELCNGCGICEYQCPLPGPAAIKIYRSLDLNISG